MTTTNAAQDGVIPVGDRLRASGPSEILQTVPYLIGFHPERSVVLIGLMPPRGRVRVTARFDLDAPAELAEPWFEAATREGVDRFLIVIYDDATGGKPLPHRDVVDAFRDMGSAYQMSLVDALYVRSARWWSYICDDPRCCPDEGKPIDKQGAMAAAAVSLGLVAAPGRSSLVDELTEDHGRAEEVVDAIEQMSEKEVERALCTERPARRRRAIITAVKHAEWLLEQYRSTRTPCEPHQAAKALMGLVNIDVRDAMIASVPLDDDESALLFWRDLCRRAPDFLAAPPATLYAICAYARGEGARTNVGIERALSVAPDYRMALLLDTAVAGGLAPDLFVPDLVTESVRLRGELMNRRR